jgi:hypothetical protein
LKSQTIDLGATRQLGSIRTAGSINPTKPLGATEVAEINSFPPAKPSSSAPPEPQTPWNVETARPQRERAALIARLLNHFWTAADPPAVRQAQIEDWLEDLREFAYDDISAACRDWRRAHTKRPSIAEIRNLCREAHQQPRPAPTDMDAYARSIGWRDNAERMAAIAADNARKVATNQRLAAEAKARNAA